MGKIMKTIDSNKDEPRIEISCIKIKSRTKAERQVQQL